jgi:hypothetical protein
MRPLSNVRCGRPVSRVGVRAFCVRVGCVCPGDFVERVGAAGSHTAGARSGRPAVRERLDHLPEPERLLVPTVRRRIGRVAQVGGGDYAARSSWAAQGRVTMVPESLPGWTATCARGRSAAATCRERRQLDANDALTCKFGVEVRGFEPLTSSVRVSDSPPLCGPTFVQVAPDRQRRS